jgi:UDP-N-acetylglucosamine 2-epimerase (non-hydrolysing)
MHGIVVFVVGTRAQLIKIAPVVLAVEAEGMQALLVMTGQHRETMDDLFTEFGISSPRIEIGNGSERATLLSLLAWAPFALMGARRRLLELRRIHGDFPVVVHGDTLSTVIGAMAARLCRLPVIHLESGLTSGKIFNPFPEEISRRAVFRLTNLALCPDANSAAHMRGRYKAEAIESGGNTIVDSVAIALGGVRREVNDRGRYIVVSIHRFQNIFNAARLSMLVEQLVEIGAAIPVHFVLHPATRKRLEASGLLGKLAGAPGVNLSPRLGYAEFLALARSAVCVLTDGGSNQEELSVLGVPTVVMREYTERLDGLGANAVMESSVEDGVVRFCLNEQFTRLRRPPATAAEIGPSARIAAVLRARFGPRRAAATAQTESN